MLESILDDVSWFIRAQVSKATKINEEIDDWKPYVLNQDVVFTGGSTGSTFTNIIILYQMDRYSTLKPCARKYQASTPIYTEEKFASKEEMETRLQVVSKSAQWFIQNASPPTLKYVNGKKFQVGEILHHIHKFYASEMTPCELKEVSETDDGWGYSKSAREALTNGTVLYREEIMGDCMRFEGLHFVHINDEGVPIYHLSLGS